jgi:hypothetical protein
MKEKANTKSGWAASVCDPGMLLALITMICLVAGMTYGSLDTGHYAVIWFCMALGFGVGMLLIRLRCIEAWTEPGWARSEIICLITAGACLAGFSYWCGMRQFGGFDHSIVIDAGWRLYCGQQPYVDFPCTVPVGFYLGAELAFRCFGVFWSSIVKWNIVYFIVTYFWMYAVLRQVFQNKYLAMVLVITCESMTLILASYWWYNPPTSMTVALYVASVAAVTLRPDSGWLWASLCLSLFLTSLMKPNVSSVAIAGGTAALLMNPRTASNAVAASAVAFVLWMGTIAIHGSNIAQVVVSYLGVAPRGFSSGQFFDGLGPQERTFAWACTCAVLPGLVHAAWPKPLFRRRLPLVILGALAILASLFGFYGNGEAKLVDLSVGLLATAILMGNPISSKWVSYLILVCSTFTFSALGEAATRYRVRGIGMGTFFEYVTEKGPIHNDFFKGVSGGHNLHVAVDAITSLCSGRNVQNIYFGPRLQWAYAAFHIPSPKGLPVWWHPGVAFSIADEETYTHRWIDARFDPIVVMDFSYMNAELLNTILHSYTIERSYPLGSEAATLLIMNRKK